VQLSDGENPFNRHVRSKPCLDDDSLDRPFVHIEHPNGGNHDIVRYSGYGLESEPYHSIDAIEEFDVEDDEIPRIHFD
jgi:hypothetical protein